MVRELRFLENKALAKTPEVQFYDPMVETLDPEEMAYLQLGKLRRLLNLQRSDEMVRQGRLSLDQGRPPEALERALAARDKSPNNDNAWVFLARIHLRLNEKEKALKAIRQAVELNPSNARQLLHNDQFESVHNDPVFLQIVADR